MTYEITDLDLPAPWRGLRETVRVEKCALSPAVFERVRHIFLSQYAHGDCTPEPLTREYAREEFLLVVDETGRGTGDMPAILETYQAAAASYPTFAKWFQQSNLPSGGQVLLAARWLCHFMGLRHRTVEIFIDPPHLEGHTLVQVRGMDKFEAPGAFDIPCAGHVSGIDDAEDALRKELAEELNLTLDELFDFHLLAEYNSFIFSGASSGGRGVLNNEYRYLYRARLHGSAVPQIRFMDGEVAGLAVFSVAEMRALAARFPERVASGLGDSLAYYT